MLEAPLFLLAGVGEAEACAAGFQGRAVHRLPSLCGAQSGARTVEEAARKLLGNIKGMQPQGPYSVLGAFSDGLVAYEIGRQLLGRDESVDFVGMVDTGRPLNRSIAGLGLSESAAAAERYCPPPLPIAVNLFVGLHTEVRSLVDGWAPLLGERLVVESLAGLTPVQRVTESVKRFSEKVKAATSRQPTPACSAVAIQGGVSGKVPVFLVPGAGASVTSFIPLIGALDSSIPAYGLQPRGLDGIQVPHSTVASAAASYVRSIRNIYPSGPYRLVGHSFGGWIVFEMARQLESAGCKVETVVLIDSDAPASPSESHEHVDRVSAIVRLVEILEESSGKKLFVSRGNLERQDYESQLASLHGEMQRIAMLPARSKLSVVRNLVRVFETNLNTRYEPENGLAARALFLRAAERSPAELAANYDPEEAPRGWRSFVSDLEVGDVPGRHMTILQSPYVGEIAARISRVWTG